jgi:hypothetical protein
MQLFQVRAVGQSSPKCNEGLASTFPAHGAFLASGRVYGLTGPDLCALIVGTCVFIDAEHALDPGYAKKIGVDVDNLYISQPDNGEQVGSITHKKDADTHCLNYIRDFHLGSVRRGGSVTVKMTFSNLLCWLCFTLTLLPFFRCARRCLIFCVGLV